MKIEYSSRRFSNVAVNRIPFESFSLTRQIRRAKCLSNFSRVKISYKYLLEFYMKIKEHKSESRVCPQGEIFEIANNVDLYSVLDYVVTTVIRICLS